MLKIKYPASYKLLAAPLPQAHMPRRTCNTILTIKTTSARRKHSPSGTFLTLIVVFLLNCSNMLLISLLICNFSTLFFSPKPGTLSYKVSKYFFLIKKEGEVLSWSYTVLFFFCPCGLSFSGGAVLSYSGCPVLTNLSCSVALVWFPCPGCSVLRGCSDL
jgi:hypothetical protein